jgi:hypothetical protein
MTSASVWPVAQVARSHSRICAVLMTGIGMTRAWQIFRGGESGMSPDDSVRHRIVTRLSRD